MNLRSYATSWQDGAKAPNAKDGRRGKFLSTRGTQCEHFFVKIWEVLCTHTPSRPKTPCYPLDIHGLNGEAGFALTS